MSTIGIRYEMYKATVPNETMALKAVVEPIFSRPINTRKILVAAIAGRGT
jgi:hypothetical protein